MTSPDSSTTDGTDTDITSADHPAIPDIPRTNNRDVPYPITISESRYRGAYSGGLWVLTAGVYNPDEVTDAWATDTACNTFWQERRDDPEFTVEQRGGDRTAFAIAGDSPHELLAELFTYYDEDA